MTIGPPHWPCQWLSAAHRRRGHARDGRQDGDSRYFIGCGADAALVNASVQNVIIALTIPEVPRVVRLVRALVLSLREQPFVEASRATGASLWRLLLRHIAPNTLAPLIVQGGQHLRLGRHF